MTRKRVGRYSDKIRQQAGLEFAISGSLTDVSKSMDIPKNTLCQWHKQGIWDELIEQVRTENANRHISVYTKIVDEAHKITLDKLPEATAAQANIIAATATDKARLLQNQPTSIQAKTTTQDLAKEFQKLAGSMQSALKDKELITVIDVKGPTEK